MGVTNGFRKLTPARLAELQADAGEFEATCRSYRDADYLEMDKAGYELLFILDPAVVEYDNPAAKSDYPSIADVLKGGTPIHPQVDLGYGCAMLVAENSLREALPEFASLTQAQLIEMAVANELLSEMLMCDVDESMIADYHWPYLQSLAAFLQEALQQDMAVLRY